MILITGSNGFVGKALCQTLRDRGFAVRATARHAIGDDTFPVGDLSGSTEWQSALLGCDTVIHLAARVHVMADVHSDPLRAYREVNVDGSINLARQAAECGVKRFVFVSSVKVHGEGTHDTPYRSTDRPAPCDAYGISKLEAETALLQLGQTTGMQIVIVRPPLVYGPGVKANFLNLIKVVRRGIPLPFGCAAGRRSMVAIENLVDLLILCTQHPKAPGQVFLVSDGADLTIGELVRMLAQALGKKVVLLPVPVWMMRTSAKVLGKSAIADRLFGSLQVDITHTRATLGWSPIVSAQGAIDQTVAAFLRLEKSKTR